MKRAALSALVLTFVGCFGSGPPPPPLTDVAREHVRKELAFRKLPQPETLEVRDHFVVADYQVSAQQGRRAQAFGQECLIAICEALLDKGFRNYRVNVNGPPPGTGLTMRYGSARFIDSGGTVEWLTP